MISCQNCGMNISCIYITFSCMEMKFPCMKMTFSCMKMMIPWKVMKIVTPNFYENSMHEIVHIPNFHEHLWLQTNHPRKFEGQNFYFHAWNFQFKSCFFIFMHESFSLNHAWSWKCSCIKISFRSNMYSIITFRNIFTLVRIHTWSYILIWLMKYRGFLKKFRKASISQIFL